MFYSTFSDDEFVFDKVYQEHVRLAFWITYNVLHNRDSALDATQETFLKYYRHRSKLKDAKKLKNWIAVTAYHTALDMSKEECHTKKEISIEDENSLNRFMADLISSSPEMEVLIEESVDEIDKAIDELDHKYIEVLRLKYYLEANPDEIAKTLNIPVQTVYTRIRRGTQALRQKLSKLYKDYFKKGDEKVVNKK